MRNLMSLLLLLVASLGFAQETGTDSKTILIEQLEEVVVSSKVIDVAKRKRNTNCI
jgi:hypothetical protein